MADEILLIWTELDDSLQSLNDRVWRCLIPEQSILRPWSDPFDPPFEEDRPDLLVAYGSSVDRIEAGPTRFILTGEVGGGIGEAGVERESE